MAWMNNGWVIGIGSSIVSGIVVALITRFFLSKKEKREDQQKINGANREIIYAVRPGISEGQIPAREVIVALTHSTARRNGVPEADLYNPEEIAEELIKEVMDSSFLSAAKKAEYCSQLMPITTPPSVKIPTNDANLSLAELKTRRSEEERQRQKRRENAVTTSVLFGMFAMFMSGAIVLFKELPLLKDASTKIENVLPILISIVALIMAFFTTALFTLLRKSAQRRRDDEKMEQTTSDLRARVQKTIEDMRQQARRKD